MRVHVCIYSFIIHWPHHLLLASVRCCTRLKELLLEKLSQLGFDPKAFGMHSLWAGGATAGVVDRYMHFKWHGLWKSDRLCKGLTKICQKVWAFNPSPFLCVFYVAVVMFCRHNDDTKPTEYHIVC